jgi:hypothetical protein
LADKQEEQDMDSLSKTTSASDFRTPPRILIPKLVHSRDRWKAKATAYKRQHRKEKIHSRDLSLSRQQWKDRALDAQHKLHDLQLQLERSQADLALAHAQLAQSDDNSKKN